MKILHTLTSAELQVTKETPKMYITKVTKIPVGTFVHIRIGDLVKVSKAAVGITYQIIN